MGTYDRLKGKKAGKLTDLDAIEKSISSMDMKFKTVDIEMSQCKSRIHVFEESAQFVANVHDEQTSIKTR